ncbi:hypothetical protein K7X08_029747 [Anisodus acutangulus]|uniref:Uncharacterized protein n=1 Tax=Anisodus acutangulus TaxID=402998 RepID=A0A9Q1QW86_9SOLA|nr:hypothetical protein K7X08_029747 [Anisodus acutangulus]
MITCRDGRKLEGKVAVITGAASDIGKETAAKFISHGAKVIDADIQKAARPRNGKRARTKRLRHKRIRHLRRTGFCRLQAWIARHNVQQCRDSMSTPFSIVDLDLAQFDRIMAINVRGVVAGIKHTAQVMILQGSGCILCTGSITGVMGGLAQPTYSTTKSCVIGIVRSMAGELWKHGIRINCISPFVITTAFSLDEMKEYFPGVEPEGLVKILQNASELKGAYCEPIDVANAALFLASEDAKFISGQNLMVDGGFTSFKSLNLSHLVQ